MSSGLFPCGGCQRHVRTSEHACPFCGKALVRSEPLTELRLLTPLDRSRIVALGAVLSAAGIALSCREPAVAIYGAPPSPPTSVEQPEERAPAPPLTIATPPNPAAPPSASAPLQPEPPPPATTAVPPPPPPPKPTATSKPAPAPTEGRDPRMAPAYGGPPSPRLIPDIPK